MFPDKKPRIVKKHALAFITAKERWDHMAAGINNEDFETGELNFPAFFPGPQNTNGGIVVFAIVEAGSNAEAWNQVQNRLPIHTSLWCALAPNATTTSAFAKIVAEYTNIDELVPPVFEEA